MTINFIMHLFLLQVHCFCLGQWMYLLILQHLIVSVFDYKQMHSCNCVNPRHKYDLLYERCITQDSRLYQQHNFILYLSYIYKLYFIHRTEIVCLCTYACVQHVCLLIASEAINQFAPNWHAYAMKPRRDFSKVRTPNKCPGGGNFVAKTPNI